MLFVFAVHDFVFLFLSVCGANTCVRRPMMTTEILPRFALVCGFPSLTLDFSSNVSVTEPSQIGEGSITYLDGDSEVEVVYVKEATAEQAALAKKLLLPPTFFCYQNEQGYTSDDQTDGECQKVFVYLFVFYSKVI